VAKQLLRAGVWLAVLASLLAGGDLIRQVATASAERLGTPDPTDLQGHIIHDHALRVRAGQPLYREPDDTFCSLLYTPLYYYACAAVMAFTGTDIVACRITSVLLLGAAIASLTAFVARVTRSAPAAALVPPMALAGYAGSGFFYDAPRVDAASAALVVLSVLAGSGASRGRGGVLVGMLLFAAFFAKQSTSAFAMPFLLVLLLRGRVVAMSAAVTYVSLTAAGIALATWSTDGWFWRFCLIMPGEHPLPADRAIANLADDWGVRLRGLSIAVIAVAAALGFRKRAGRGAGSVTAETAAESTTAAADRSLGFLLAAFLAVIVMTTLSHGREGGTVKTLIPACLLVAGIVPIGLWCAVRSAPTGARDGVTIVAAGVFAFVALEGRFAREDAVLVQDDVRAWATLAEHVKRHARSGEVWTALSGYPELPGQPMRPGELAINDYLKAGRSGMPAELVEAVASHRFAAIVLRESLSRPGGDRRTELSRLVQEHYRVGERVSVPAGISRKRITAVVYVPAEPRASSARRTDASASRNAASTTRWKEGFAFRKREHSRTATAAAFSGG